MKDIFSIIEFGPSRHARFNKEKNSGVNSDDTKNNGEKKYEQKIQVGKQQLHNDQHFSFDIRNDLIGEEIQNVQLEKQQVQEVQIEHHQVPRKEFILHNDDFNKIEKPQAYFGSCGRDKKIWRRSYEEEVERIKKEDPSLSPSEVRHKAVINKRLQYRGDTVSIHNEESNEKKYESTKFFWEEERGVTYKGDGYDTGIESFHTRQKDIMPERYDVWDHCTSKAINDAFRNGAEKVVTSYFREGQDHRDILVMHLDPKTKQGTMTVINTAPDGNFHTFEGIINIAKEQFSSLKEMHPSEKTFLLVDKEIPLQQIQHPLEQIKEQFQVWNQSRNVMDHNTISKHVDIQKNNFSKEDGLLGHFGTDRIIRDISLTKKRFDQFRKESASRESIMPRYPYQMREKPGEHIHKKDTKIKSKDHGITEIVRQKSKHIETQHKKMLEKKVVVGVIKETNVGIGASIFILREMAEQPIVHFSKKEKKLLRKMERKNRQFIGKEKQKKIVLEKDNMVKKILLEGRKRQRKEKRLSQKKKQKELHLGKKELHIKKKEKKRGILFSKEAKAQLHKEKKLHKKEKRGKKELHGKKQKEIDMFKKEKIYTMFFEQWKKIARRIEHIEKHTRKSMQKKEHGKRKEKQGKRMEQEHVNFKKKERMLFFIQGFLLLTLLQKEKLFHNDKKHIMQEKENKERAKEEHDTPWVLLSIIWYMTMIREQGLVQYRPKKKKKKLEKKKKREGVIFDRNTHYTTATSLVIML